MCLAWMLLCLLLRPSAAQNAAPEGGKLQQLHVDTTDPVESMFLIIQTRAIDLEAMTESKKATIKFT